MSKAQNPERGGVKSGKGVAGILDRRNTGFGGLLIDWKTVFHDKENSEVRLVDVCVDHVAKLKPKPTSGGLGSSSSTTVPGSSSPSSSSSAAATAAPKKASPLKRKFTSIPVKVDGKPFTTRPAFDTFWEYASERHAVEERRRAGRPQPWSKKSVFREYKFCSVFRVADRGSQFLIKEVIEKGGSQEEEELLFRVLLYSSFVRVETYKLLSAALGPLSWKTYDHAKYARVLLEAADNGDSIYTGAFQKFPPQLGYSHAHENHLALLEIMMSNDLLGKLKGCKYMADAFDVIYQFPGSGDFVAFQLLINLSYTPLVDFSENDFVIAGVGAVKGLKKCFSPSDSVSGSESALIRWMTETQEKHFARLRLEPAVLSNGNGDEERKMTLVDVEHTLCELHKYVRILSSAEGGGYGKRFTQKTARLARWPVFPRAWAHPTRTRTRLKPGRSGNKRAEKVYVVNRILDKGETDEGEVVYFVDWLGYPASARTWEPRESLLDDAPLAVEEYERESSAGSSSRKRKRE
ncbi:hypothetical protein A7U60_g8331 [Sanghuangporus baumii]|uniref:Chromo domain-containing protein n=1 Tax=Sanghuangporus baumii TaxID=108892 RepID=A0A9Q5HRT6_SANBA|nr:hypothetical protein A7U60_g8331 [Sanghuangporus baumii]